MKIKEPKLIFSNSQRAFREYALLYNAGKEKRDQLKPAHFSQFYTYLRLFQRNMAQNNNKAINADDLGAMMLDTDQMPHLFTNNTELRKQLDGGASSTILRRFQRLADAGVLRKIKHGPVKNYEIIINPYLLFIIDESGADARHRINIEKAQKWVDIGDLATVKSANCTQNIVSFKNNSNKIIIHEKESATADISSIETKKDTSKKDTTRNLINLSDDKKIKDFGDAVLSSLNKQLLAKKSEIVAEKISTADKMRQKFGIKEPKPDYALLHAEKMRKKEAEMKTLRLQYAVMMVQLMIDYLLKGINVFPGERKRTISYVAEHYFGQCLTYSGLVRTWTGYAQRLEEARQFKEAHPDYTPYPFYYFNKDNPKGFESMEWRKNKLKFERQKRWQSNQSKLLATLRRINKNPETATLEREIQYVKDNIPDLLKAFFKNIYTDYPQLIKQQQITKQKNHA